MKVDTKLPAQARCGIILAHTSAISPIAWEDRLTRASQAIADAMPDSDVCALVTDADLAELRDIILDHRPMGAPFEGCINVSLAGPGNFEAFTALIPILEEQLGDVLDRGRCSATIGDAYVATPGHGNYSITMITYCDPAIDGEQFMAWWTSHHSEHNLNAPSKGVMQGYALNYRADPATADFNRAMGFSDDTEIFEPCYMRSKAEIEAMVSPEVARAAFDDETGYVAHDRIVAELQRTVFDVTRTPLGTSVSHS